jgi:hypothetical protein
VPRKVDRLQWARLCERPSVLPKRRVHYRNLKAVGLRFEKAVCAAVKSLRMGATVHGQWFEYFDANGHGYCQTDVLVLRRDDALVLECKLTEVEEAEAQLEDLYVPIVRRVYRLPVVGIVVVRHLTRLTNAARVCDSLEAAIKAEPWPILHWIGRGPIGHVAAMPRSPALTQGCASPHDMAATLARRTGNDAQR